jgi:formylglycine-generating enzyme required for sulfatase activity
VDIALGVANDAKNPAERWIAAYEQAATLGEAGPATPQPIGSAGRNEFGIADLSGNIWEWTATCGSRTSLDAQGGKLAEIENCGVRYLEGRHRTAMSDFVRDAVGGGCSAGVPPDNLGFRLVRDRPWHAPLIDWFA